MKGKPCDDLLGKLKTEETNKMGSSPYKVRLHFADQSRIDKICNMCSQSFDTPFEVVSFSLIQNWEDLRLK